MLIVYIDNGQACDLAALEAAYPGVPVVRCTPTYFRGPADCETGARGVLLVREHPRIRATYAARGVPVALLADVLPSPTPPAPPRYTIQPRGAGGWHDVLDADGQAVNARALQRAEAEALLRELTGE